MEINVLLSGAWEDEYAKYLEELLLPNVRLLREHDNEDFDILVCGRPDETVLNASSRLRHLIIPWAGLPASTSELMTRYNHISVYNIHHNAVSAAELAISLMLAAARRIVPADRDLRLGDWSWRYRQDRSVIISGSRILVLGYGHIGSRIGSVCKSMGARISGIRRNLIEKVVSNGIMLHPPHALHDILRNTDILFISLPLTSETEGIIGEQELDLLHDRSIIVNIGRSRLINEISLYEHLRDGSIGAAGIDVWYNYPVSGSSDAVTHPSSYPFGNLDNIVMTPHLGGAFGSSRTEKLRMEHIADSVNMAAKGADIPFRINLESGY